MVAKILLVAADAAICAGVKRVIERHCACSANVKCAAWLAEAGKMAEGVERQDQINFLKGLNCAEGQGYFYGEPVDALSFEQILARNDSTPFGLWH